ncbi:hypothetical protein GCM10009758_32020 [Microbacterium hatanonis]
MGKRVDERTTAVYAYEDGAARSFAAAAEHDVPRIYDLPIGYWRLGEVLLNEEAEAEPAWASTISMTTVRNHAERMSRKDLELSLASEIVVASSFTARSLNLYPGSAPRVTVVPYGAPPPVRTRVKRDPSRIRALYVGSLTQRKGISYLFSAVRASGRRVELTVVGRQVGANAAVDSALRAENVNWIPSLAHGAILDLMSNHDVLIFPSLFEGFGLVLMEALSRGLPVISTAHTGAPDIISDGVEGWIVPVRSASAISEKLDLLLQDSRRVDDMSDAAFSRAHDLSWSNHRAKLIEVARRNIR